MLLLVVADVYMCTRKYKVYLDNIYAVFYQEVWTEQKHQPTHKAAAKIKKNIFLSQRPNYEEMWCWFVVRYLKNFFILVYTLYSDDHDDMLICTNIHPYKKYFIL